MTSPVSARAGGRFRLSAPRPGEPARALRRLRARRPRANPAQLPHSSTDHVGVTTAANAGVPAHRAGLAAALLNSSQQVGSALGLAIFSAVATARTNHLLSVRTPVPEALTSGFSRALLTGIPGLALKEIAEAELCCGSAGVYNLLNPVPAAQLGDRKAGNVLATGAEAIKSRKRRNSVEVNKRNE